MESGRPMWMVVAAFAVLAIPTQLAAQHTTYKLVDMGTLGGPASYLTEPGAGRGFLVLNSRGELAGKSDTPIPNNGSGNCPPICFAAQDGQQKKHHHYQFVDLGTLGGPNSGVPTVFYEINGTAGARAISDQGTVTGTADTSTPDPLCFFDDCFYPNVFQWQNGVLTNLGALPNSQWSAANWISGNGLIAGLSENGQTDPLTGTPEARAVFWQNGQITDLGTLPGGSESLGWAVNNGGQVVGFSTNGTPDPYSYFYFQILGSSAGTQGRAFLWDKQNGMQDLGTLGGPDAWAGLVNERGQVAGISYTSSTANANNANCAPNTPTQDPFFWEKETGMIDIGSFGGTCGITNALNNRGQVAGQSYLAGNLTAHAFLWDKNGHPQMKDLGTLGGDNASALWIDDAGDVVGYADLPPNPPGCTGLTCVHHGVLWKHGMMTDLGSVDGDPCSRALSINSRGQIVGASAEICGGNLTHGFLWEKGGPAIDLNTLVPPGSGLALTEPIYINDRGEIAGFGVLSNGDTHAFLLIPCGEGDASCGNDAAGTAAATRVSPAGHTILAFGMRSGYRRHFAGLSGPIATLSPTKLKFATQLVGTNSKAKSVTLSNTGTTTLNISGIAASGDFSQSNNCGSSLAAGASCTISVTFTPTQLGTRTGTVSVTDNAPGSPQTVSLTGTGTVVELVPQSLNFGTVTIGQSKTLQTTLTNVGSTTLSITGVTLLGSGEFFQTNNCDGSVGAGMSCTISVTFKPTEGGNASGDVSISDNGGGSPQIVKLKGNAPFVCPSRACQGQAFFCHMCGVCGLGQGRLSCRDSSGACYKCVP